VLNKAISVAKTRSRIKRHKTGAVITDSKGKIVSLGWSHMTMVSRARYYSMHAELHAILRANPKRLNGATIYIATVCKSGNVTSAKPCDACEAIIREVGIKSVVYTEYKEVNREKGRSMVTDTGARK
jgi:deoxycytidylate deaminase